MNRIRCVNFEALPKTVAQNLDRLGDLPDGNLGDNITYISKGRKWLRKFDDFGYVHDDNAVELSSLETVQAMERHLGILARNGLAIPNRMHYFVPMSKDNSAPALYSLVDHISEEPFRNWYDAAHALKRATMRKSIGAYMEWVEHSGERYGMVDLAKSGQAVYGSAPGHTDEKTYLVDIEPLFTDITHINGDGVNVWEAQKDLLSRL